MDQLRALFQSEQWLFIFSPIVFVVVVVVVVVVVAVVVVVVVVVVVAVVVVVVVVVVVGVVREASGLHPDHARHQSKKAGGIRLS